MSDDPFDLPRVARHADPVVTTSEPVTQELVSAEGERHFPCPTCGSDLRFSPDTGVMSCDHCGHSEAIDAQAPHPVRELDFAAAIDQLLPAQDVQETRTTQCPNCGAQVAFSDDVHARECPFCATPVVVSTGLHRQIKPRGLLPFKLAEDAAKEAMTDWLGKLWFAPNGLAEYARKGRKMQGIYVPYWTFDAQTHSDYTGQRGDDYYTSHSVVRNGKRETVRKRHTRWSRRSGRVARFFDDVLVLASHSLPRKYTQALEPWDLAALEPYIPEYLAGFRAESYTVEIKEGYAQARSAMDAMILRDVRFDIGGDRQRVEQVTTRVSDVTFKHILLPVWLAAYKYRGKTYRFVVNGRTGTIQGERPYSAWKIAFAVVAGAILAAVVGYFIAQNQ
ncbi:hypothetical protein AQS8620_02618 [Aquimixticola soesokkakensis]|uniref:Primosomal protein N' (Replication factor Y)-superfamily II helicase n=1 Tax=Aquimixticola soesokkakensis TaxID=1519096 RepID=A0A1Y5TFE1_9RHOB|nr:TFIIB-type zinc finger domain-containing protein [Aquimixticola soesokkakensis]SLN59032.1 hypothetical protein AQS8620_02618 [Aquimixticola soesokkakensis]